MSKFTPNTFIQNLAAICAEHLLAEKYLLAPNRRVGNQWVEQVARSGQLAVNLRVTTFRSLVMELSGAEPAGLLSDRGSEILLSRVLHDLRADDPLYFTTLEPFPALVAALTRTIAELRAAGISHTALDAETRRRGDTGKNQNLKMRELAALLAGYEAGLADGGYIDHGGLLADVAAELTSGAVALPEGRMLLVPDDTGLGRPEERVLDLLPAVTVKGLVPVCPPEKPPLTDLARMAWLASPADAPAPFDDDTLRILGASGEVNEVRAALRQCLAENWPFDQVEILYTDRDTYLPLLFEVLARYSGVETGDLDALPATFSEGIPVRYSRPGRALTAWALWILEGFPTAALAGMIREGLISIDGGDTLAQRGQAADILRQTALGTIGDPGRLIEALAARREALIQKETEKEDEASDRTPDASAIASLEKILKTVSRTVPAPDAPLPDVLDCAQRFLIEAVRTAGELDEYARTALLSDIADAGRRMEELSHVPAGEPLGWLLSLVGEVRVAGSAPRAGKVHIAPLSAGGHSGRSHVIVLGLDDSRHPGSERPEPVLLDREREEISGLLRLAGEDLTRREGSLAALAARMGSGNGQSSGLPPATLTLTCSLQDLVQDRDTFPGAAMVRAYRILKDPMADQEALLAYLSPPGGFIDPDAGACLDSAEWWIDRFTAPQSIPDARPAFLGRFPHLKQGQAAMEVKGALAPTSWEGLVGSLSPELDMMSENGPAVSANRLQTLGRCPLRYFFSYLLDIQRVDEDPPEPDRWLSPLDRGIILHDLFHEYMDGLIKAGDVPDAERDGPELMWALEEMLSRHEAAAPPPSHQVRDHEASQLADAVSIFLSEEELFTADHEPLYAEASIGLASTVLPTELDCPEPISVTLSSGRVIRVRGRIDRIDRRRGDGQFVITDYKSGSKSPFEKKDRFNEGRLVQHLLYLLMVEARLKETLALAPPVAAFRFLFPTTRDQGESVVLSKEELEERMDVLEDLCSLAESGCFAPTDTARDCDWCDYTLICGDTTNQARRMAAKLEEGEDPRLDPVRRLRGYV